ncbi:DUF2567 domain-containing protein [Nocardia sp. NPDC052566]|uniref:DUF2567 domain-containing protein n=1 Tax=Nocardia sp. NPDC052566 TaxID=3364330 RepID=UPI0037C9CF23
MGSRETRAAALVGAVVLLVSALGGVVWGLLAPGQQFLVVEPSGQCDKDALCGALLIGESAHRFDAVAIFLCLGAVIGVLCAAAAWRRRAMRGPALQLALLIASGVGAAVMWQVGDQVARWHHPKPTTPPVGQIVTIAPELDTWLALLLQPLVASLVVLFLAALSASEDLGTGNRAPFGDPGAEPRHAASTFGSYGPDAAMLPYGGYEPAGEAGSGAAPGSR